MGLPELAEPLGEMSPTQPAPDPSVDRGRRVLEHGNGDLEQVRRELLNGAGGLAAKAGRVMRWQAMLTWFSVGLVTLLVLLLADVLLRREELGLRVLSLAAWLLVLAWFAFKLLRPAWRFSLTPVQAVQWLERERPDLGHQLSTAVELSGLSASDSRYGSSRFREAALRAWSERGQSLNWPAHIQQRGLRRALGLLFIACGAFAAVAVVWPSEMRVALARFTVPWASNAWPRRDHLQIVQLPTVIADGSELQLEVIDERPPLPDGVELQVRGVGPDGGDNVRSFETTLVGDVAVGNLPTMNAAFEVRAVGGDDQRMPWQRVEVVQPPELDGFQFAVLPPSYTGLGRSEVVGRRISVLAGSQVEFIGRFDRPVASVTVQMAEAIADTPVEPTAEPTAEPPVEPTASPAAQAAWTVTLGDGGHELHLGGADTPLLEMQQSLNWQLLVATADGLEVLLRERWSIEVTNDEPPRVVFQTVDMAELAKDAQLSLRGEAGDDLGLIEVRARLQLSGDDSAPAAILPIWQMPTTTQSGELPREVAIDTAWDIARAGDFVAGQRLAVWLEARDSADQWGQSQVQHLEIRDSNELIESIQERQNQLLAQVRELVDTQRRNSQSFSRAWELTQHQGKVQREQLDALRNTAQVQRAVAQRLGGSDAQGLSQEIAKLRELLQANRLDDTAVATELQELEASVQSLGQGPLAAAAEATRKTAALAESALSEDASIAEGLVNSAEQTQTAQAAALRGLEGLLARLARNESLQQATTELAQILNQQNAIRTETDRLQLATLSSSSEASAAELQAGKTALSSDQQGLARRLDDWLARSSELQNQPQDQQQAAKEALAQATQGLMSAQASAQMRRATEEIRDQQLARAAATQQQVSELLAESLRQMGAANPTQLGNLRNRAEGLRQLSDELSAMAKTQSELSERWHEPTAEGELEQLIGDQADAQQQTSGLADQAERSGSASLSAEIGRASDSQQQAQRAGQQNNFEQAEQASRQAAQQLAQTSAQLEQRAAALEKQAAQQQIFQLADAIEELTSLQRPITQKFSQWDDTAGDDSAGLRQQQQAEMRGAASRQEAVRQVLRELRSETSELPVFDWTLQQSESAMGRAVAAAQRYRIKPDAQDAADRALRLLRLAADAMRDDPAASSDPAEPRSADEASSESNPDNPSQPQDSAGRSAPMVASLKLLRYLQQELNQQTQATEAIDDVVRRTSQMGELARLQQELAAQVEQLLNSQP